MRKFRISDREARRYEREGIGGLVEHCKGAYSREPESCMSTVGARIVVESGGCMSTVGVHIEGSSEAEPGG